MAGVIRTMPSHSGRSAPRLVKAPRPPNAWIIYRSDKVHQLPPPEPGQPRRAQAEVSKMISNMWANESEETRQEYERRAEEAKAAHALKYPGYRFKPMKKEEKKAQRELEKDERLARRREQQKQKSGTGSSESPSSSSLSDRGVSAPPAAVHYTASTANFTHAPYYASVSNPVDVPHMATHPISNPYSLPFVPFFQSQARFGPAGPTPPVSAAASPSEADSSPSPEATATCTTTDDSHNTTHSSSPSNAGHTNVQAPKTVAPIPFVADKAVAATTTPSSRGTIEGPLYPPAFDRVAFAAGQEWPHAAPRVTENANATAISTNTGTLTPAMTPSPIWQNGDSKHTQQRQAAVPSTIPTSTTAAASTTSAQIPESVSFDFSGFQLQNFEHFLTGAVSGAAPGDASSASSLSAFLTATTDPSVFRLDHLEPSQLLDNPTGEIEVSLGEFLPPDLSSFPTDLFNFGDPSTFGAGLDIGLGLGLGVHGFSQTENSMQQQQQQQDVFFPSFTGTQGSATATVDGSNNNSNNGAYNPDEFLDFGNADFQTVGPTSLNGYATPTTITPPHTVTSATATTGGGYTPPAGAANSSYRRVGGSWNKQFVQAQTPSPPRSLRVMHS